MIMESPEFSLQRIHFWWRQVSATEDAFQDSSDEEVSSLELDGLLFYVTSGKLTLL